MHISLQTVSQTMCSCHATFKLDTAIIREVCHRLQPEQQLAQEVDKLRNAINVLQQQNERIIELVQAGQRANNL